MRTSNKILIGLLVLVFSVPFITASVLKSKIKKGEYKIVKTGNKNSLKIISRSIDPVKVLDIAASDPDLLYCRLIPADSTKYVYHRSSESDSLTIYQKNDTLFIRHPYVVTKSDKPKFSYFEVEVFLPRFNDLVVDGASVFIDSFPNPLGSFNLMLKNGGTVSVKKHQ